MRWTPTATGPMTLVTEPDGPVIVVNHDELDAIAHTLADRAAELIRDHLHLDLDLDDHAEDDESWCPLCQAHVPR